MPVNAQCCGKWIVVSESGAGFSRDFDCRVFMRDQKPETEAQRRAICQQLFDADRMCPDIAPFCEPFKDDLQRNRSRARDGSDDPVQPSGTGDSPDEPPIEFPPMLVPPSRVAEVDAEADRLHDRRVVEYINRMIQAYGNPNNTVPENLANAQSAVVSEREADGTNTVLRDAEYYLKARAMIAGRQSKPDRVACTVGGIGLTLIYNALKGVFGTVMRTNPNNPNSPPGGVEWVERGATDGYHDAFDAMGPASPAK